MVNSSAPLRRTTRWPPKASQRLAEQLLAGAGQESGQRRRLEQAAAERVGDQHIAGAHGLQQAGNAERRIAAQFERIAVSRRRAGAGWRARGAGR
jgi:hypothetical protein